MTISSQGANYRSFRSVGPNSTGFGVIVIETRLRMLSPDQSPKRGPLIAMIGIWTSRRIGPSGDAFTSQPSITGKTDVHQNDVRIFRMRQ